MKKLYLCDTKAGPFYIGTHNGRFYPIFRDENLGGYATPEQALDDLVGGHTFTLPGRVDPTTLDIPRELADWQRLSNPTASND